MIFRKINLALVFDGRYGHHGSAQSPRTIQSSIKTGVSGRGDFPGAEAAAFSDASWRLLDVPHDWASKALTIRNNPTGRGWRLLPSASAGTGKHLC